MKNIPKVFFGSTDKLYVSSNQAATKEEIKMSDSKRNTVVILKAETVKRLNEIYSNESHFLHDQLKAVLNGEYLASKRFSDKMLGYLISDIPKIDANGMTLNAISEPIVADKDTIRRYIHQWRAKKLAQLETEKAQANQVVTTQGQ